MRRPKIKGNKSMLGTSRNPFNKPSITNKDIDDLLRGDKESEPISNTLLVRYVTVGDEVFYKGKKWVAKKKYTDKVDFDSFVLPGFFSLTLDNSIEIEIDR